MRKSIISTILLACCLTGFGFDFASGNRSLKSGSGSDNGENYDVSFYLLDLNISDSSTYIRGSVSIYVFLSDQSSHQVTLDMANILSTDSVRVNNSPAEFSHMNNKLTIDLPAMDITDSRQVLKVFYHGLGKNSGEVSGIFNKYNSAWNKQITWTLSEPFSALNWFPCKQSLIDKADSVYVFLSTDKGVKAGSNGLLTASVELPADRVRYEWKCRYPVDYYLISFAVCDYMDYSFFAKRGDRTDSILVQNYIYNDSTYFEQNKSSIDKTTELINLYTDLFGVYPFLSEKYGHCVAPAGGGMEHQTMTTLVNFSYLLVAHELSHQWFGDYVTCKTWQDIWINEGFASYAEYLANQYLISQTSAEGWMSRTHDFVKSVPGGCVFVPEESAEDEDRIFDSRLTYSKGAAIIHMIRQEVGNDELFFSILREFLQRYKNSNATGADFRDLLEEMTGKDFNLFFDQWYYGEGFPNLSINWSHKNDTLYISSLQTVSASTPIFNLLLEYKITINNHDTVISHRQDSSFDNWRVYLPGEVSRLSIDPRHWLLMNVSNINQAISIDNQSHYLILPNPARDKITLRFAEPVDTYMIYLSDTSGKILYTEQSKSMRKTIDIEKLPKGMYFVIVNEKNLIYPARFIKN
jgi:aminopeptidase N